MMVSDKVSTLEGIPVHWEAILKGVRIYRVIDWNCWNGHLNKLCLGGGLITPVTLHHRCALDNNSSTEWRTTKRCLIVHTDLRNQTFILVFTNNLISLILVLINGTIRNGPNNAHDGILPARLSGKKMFTYNLYIKYCRIRHLHRFYNTFSYTTHI